MVENVNFTPETAPERYLVLELWVWVEDNNTEYPIFKVFDAGTKINESASLSCKLSASGDVMLGPHSVL